MPETMPGRAPEARPLRNNWRILNPSDMDAFMNFLRQLVLEKREFAVTNVGDCDVVVVINGGVEHLGGRT